MSAIQNLRSFDPFADASKGDDLLPAGTEDYIHIRIQQRNGRKTLTTVQLQGDQRKNICQFLVEIGLAKDDQLKVHGF
ncbi:eukaryotic translation initiation factor 1-like [Pipistrellus kuhlii]|uniref:eukaryotic translation initiation factor 1-like n=1 Tax=Pipistrellus kuhlii TaxID=59472 RepID=UPI00174ED149|nr:eukaryotic translation initiation factor 1-like [Pipistrellus kuhlii]